MLEKAGCYDFHIAGNYYEDKLENEVRYYTHEGDGKFVEEKASGREDAAHEGSLLNMFLYGKQGAAVLESRVTEEDDVCLRNHFRRLGTYFMDRGPQVLSLWSMDTKGILP